MERIETGDALAGFLFDLMRDRVATGYVEEIIVNAEKVGPKVLWFETSSRHLGAYAIELAKRIRALDAPAELLGDPEA